MPLNETQSLAQKQAEQLVPINKELENELRESAKNQQAKFYGLTREDFLKLDFINITPLDKASFATGKAAQQSLNFDKLFIQGKGDDTIDQRPLYILTEKGKEPGQRNIQVYTDERDAQKAYAVVKDNYPSSTDDLHYLGISGQEIHIRKNIAELTQANDKGEVPRYDQIFQITSQQKQQIESLIEPDITRAIKLLLSKESPQIYPEITFPEKMDQTKKLNFLEQAKNNILESFTGQNVKLDTSSIQTKENNQKGSQSIINGLDKLIPISGHEIKQVDPILGGILDGLQKGLKDLVISQENGKPRSLQENKLPQSIYGQTFTPEEYKALSTHKEMNGLIQANGKTHVVSVSSNNKLVTKPLDEFKIPTKIEGIPLTPEQKDTLAKGKVVELQNSDSHKVINVKLSASQPTGIAEVSGMINYRQKISSEELIKPNSPIISNKETEEVNQKPQSQVIPPLDNQINTQSSVAINEVQQQLTEEQHSTLTKFRELPGLIPINGKEHIVSMFSDNQIISRNIEDFKIPAKINGTLLTVEQKESLSKGEIVNLDSLWLKLSAASKNGVTEVSLLKNHMNLSNTKEDDKITARDIYKALTPDQLNILYNTHQLPSPVTVKGQELVVTVGKDGGIIGETRKNTISEQIHNSQTKTETKQNQELNKENKLPAPIKVGEELKESVRPRIRH
ncbi:DUF3945 domain-containing protein [Siphonobacter sp. SORGH_AS_1065]|uniref:DUF3945 domain-containing protein n=1 Tax=Siphonobacter sp. SORGH_AS_1065 TaxID=3041795 RepID=UPI00278A9474|nr:DUF3945 domain-containing protein [Siphonobacter sp. SORGH_AS_1065]MDQ1090431.1 hypothetical protein [Siphonobacter sp. SORGH_AS_1065]